MPLRRAVIVRFSFVENGGTLAALAVPTPDAEPAASANEIITPVAVPVPAAVPLVSAVLVAVPAAVPVLTAQRGRV